MRRIRAHDLPADSRARDVLAKFLEGARERAPDSIEQVVVYGSFARGEGRQDSDLDLWIDWRGDEHQGRRLLGDLAADLFLETGLIVSVHVVDAAHRGRLRAMRSAFYHEVEREGLVVEG